MQSSDTDVIIILIGNMHLAKNRVKVWIRKSRNDLRYINISSIANKFGQQMSQAMPAFHALFGSDYTSTFF